MPGSCVAAAGCGQSGRTSRRGVALGFVSAAYGIVIGSLLAYGIWVQRERRRLARELAELARPGGGSASPRE